jgi:hypothetical protein
MPTTKTFAIGKAPTINYSTARIALEPSDARINPKSTAAMATATMSQPIRKRGAFTATSWTFGKDGADQIRDESGTYVARFRDGIVVEFSTKCRAKTVAQSVLAELEPRADKLRPNLRAN